MFDTRNIPIEEFLTQIATELDISETDFKKAEAHYIAIADWLGGEGSLIAVNKPNIYPQGSFRLGTVVKPIGIDEYDVDLVCQLEMSPSSITPAELKKRVGDRLKQNATYLRLLEPEKKRCWQLNYAGDFHLDILPAIPDPSVGGSSVLITEMNNPDWLMSNPKGYAEWFEQKMIIQLTKFAEARGTNVEQVPAFAVRTPLQRAIQLLKRHRDIRFKGGASSDDKPISIIITTLAARVYQNEPDVHSTLTNIVNTLASHAPLLVQGGQINESIASRKIIEKSNEGRWNIPNPMNRVENFADKWHENGNRKANAFFQWVEWAKGDLDAIIANTPKESNGETMRTVFGTAAVGAAIGNLERSGRYNQTVPSGSHVQIKDPGKPWSPNV